MFTLINSESLWIGTDLKKMNQIRDALDLKGISYKLKTKNHLGEWTGKGTVRGNMGSIGNQTELMHQYEILVYKKDFETAKFIIGNLCDR